MHLNISLWSNLNRGMKIAEALKSHVDVQKTILEQLEVHLA